MMRPQIVDSIADPSGKVISRAEPELHRRRARASHGRSVGALMRSAVAHGTARKTFFDQKATRSCPGSKWRVKLARLSKERPYRGYTWFVSFAPANAPKVAGLR